MLQFLRILHFFFAGDHMLMSNGNGQVRIRPRQRDGWCVREILPLLENKGSVASALLAHRISLKLKWMGPQ